MHIILLLLFIFQDLHVAQLNTREKHFVNIVKRDVHSSSLQNLNRRVKTYEIDQNLVLNTPNFTWIDSLLSSISINRRKASIREHTTWLVRQIPSNQYREIARYDSIKDRFILHPQYNNNNSYAINANTGQLTLINMNESAFLYTEISIHAESGLSKGDDVLHDIYRFIRLSSSSMNCTSNVTINVDESIDIECTIEYEFFKYDDWNYSQPAINLTFYVKGKNSIYRRIDQMDLNEVKDFPIDTNRTVNWKRTIRHRIKSINKEEHNREYVCIISPDSLENEDSSSNNNRSCRTRIDIRNQNSSTVTVSRLDQLDLIDLFIIILIVSSVLLFLISFILCIAARQSHKKRTVQIKPENKSLTLPLSTNQIVTNNNETKSDIPSRASEQFPETFSSQHKPGCPKYLPSAEYNLLSSDLFTHTTIDNIKKIILPDISESNDLFDDQTYIHFYIPSKSENISMKNLH